MKKITLITSTIILLLSMHSANAARKVSVTADYQNLIPIKLAAKSINVITIENIDTDVRRLRLRDNGQKKIKIANKGKVKIRANKATRFKLKTKGRDALNEFFLLVSLDQNKNTIVNNALKIMVPKPVVCTTELAPVCGLVTFFACRETGKKVCSGDTTIQEQVTFNNQCELDSFDAVKVTDGACI